MSPNQFNQGATVNGEGELYTFNELIIGDRNIGHNWQFTEEQKQELS
ncbi:hypothetical protein IFO70_06845 [Phormidium tenue FACHB-886]|nr:hypothetical protein [Phormidium tenue FACHB-886]